MISHRILLRQLQNKSVSTLWFKCATKHYCNNSDNDKKDGKNISKSEEDKKKSNEALKKLNLLLKQMIEDDSQQATKPELKLAQPRPRLTKKESRTVSRKVESVDTQIITAAKDVAESLGGDTKKTESELLSKLLNTTSKKEDDKSISSNLSDLIAGMKIEREKIVDRATIEASRAAQIRKVLAEEPPTDIISRRARYRQIAKRSEFATDTEIEKIDLFGADPLKIFTTQQDQFRTETVELKTWNALEKRALRLAVTHPPANYFQEMILWTEQGKLWKFPIDNEQGMEEEQNISFAEHIFLEKHLEPWCPQKGPIRHFMELVCVGLSKNPYITVQAKKDHIFWYKDYFESKKKLLQEVGALPPAESSGKKDITDQANNN